MKLPEPVKRFIELNIDFIEKNDWYKVFVNWYTNGDDYYLFEFVEALHEAGINIDDYADERKRVIEQMIRATLTNYLQKSNKVTKSYIEESLASDLGLTYDDIQDIIDRVTKELKLTKATNGWYRL